MRVLVAGTETAAAHIPATGLVASQEEARLGFKTGGVITAMLVDAGDRVQRGQTLAQLNATLAWVIIGGLLSSTFLARLVTPVMYLVMAPPLRPPVDDETA